MTKICESCVLRNTGVCAVLIGNPPDKQVFENRKSGMTPVRRFLQKGVATKSDVKIIRKGWAASVEMSGDGKLITSEVLVPGDVVGGSLLSDGGATLSVRAMTDVEYCSFDSEFLKGLIQSRRDLLEISIRVSSDMTRALRGRVVDLGTRGAEERIASLIVGLHDKLEARGLLRGMKMPFPLRQQDMADAVGLTVVHTNRVLQNLRQEGVLTIERKEIYVDDVERMRSLVA